MIKFFAFGHENIQGTHKTTFEFTKDSELSLKGDCIIGVRADFDIDQIKDQIKNFIKKLKSKKILIALQTNGLKDEIIAEFNPDFDDDKELVVRIGDFASKRTLAVRADKAAFDIKRELIEYLKNPENKIKITIESLPS